MKNTTNQSGFSSIVAILIALGVIVIGGGAYFLTQQKSPITPISQTLESNTPNIPNAIDTAPKEVSVDFVLSSLSAPKGKVDVLWNVIVPEEQRKKAQNPSLSFPYGYVGAIAEPLHLIEELKINNDTGDSVFLYGIANEQTNFLTMPSRPGRPESKATPFMLLPDKFFTEKGAVIKCKNRNIKTLIDSAIVRGLQADGSSFTKVAQNNICDFETPVEIKSKSSLTLKPELYAVSFGLAGRMVTNIFDGTHKNFVKANVASFGGQVWLVPKKYEEHDDISAKDTFNIGGYIVADTRNASLLSDILKIKNKAGQAMKVKIGNSSNGIAIKSYEIPDKPFTPAQNIFDKNVLGMQVFWYLNNFWGVSNINGVYDTKTVEMLRKFQRETKIAETGKFDKATMFVVGAFDRNASFYENPADEEVTVSFDSPLPYFRIFSIGSYKVDLNKDTSNSSLITRVAKKLCGESYCGGVYTYSLDNREIFTLSGITILNNTLETKQCSLINPSGVSVKSFSIDPNKMYSQRATFDGVSIPTTHRLQCGNKSLEIELSPEEKGR